MHGGPADGFGFADLERSVPATAQTIYHLASLAKPFGATVVLRLVDEGRLSLDSPLAYGAATFVVLANSDGLSRGRNLGRDGNLLTSPAAGLFLNWVVNRRTAS